MSLTLRGMISNTWNVMLRANPITGPYFLAKDLASTQAFQDSVKVAKDTTLKAAKAINDGANTVLDYPIEKGAKQVGDAVVTGYNVTVDATGKAVDDYVVKPTVATGKAIQKGANDAVDATVGAANDAYDATVNAANDYVVNPTVQAIDEVDKGQKAARRGLADWIAPD